MTKRNSNLSQTHKKISKKGFSNTVSQKKFITKVAKKLKRNTKKKMYKKEQGTEGEGQASESVRSNAVHSSLLQESVKAYSGC